MKHNSRTQTDQIEIPPTRAREKPIKAAIDRQANLLLEAPPTYQNTSDFKSRSESEIREIERERERSTGGLFEGERERSERRTERERERKERERE